MLSGCNLFVGLGALTVSVQQVLDALVHFAACKWLVVEGGEPDQLSRSARQLSDVELHKLLCPRTTRSCDGLSLAGFRRGEVGRVPIEDEQWQQKQQGSVIRHARSDLKRKFEVDTPVRTALFDWVSILLPVLTRLRIGVLCDGLRYIGGAAFLTLHTALVELDLTTTIVTVAELAAIFRHPTALPLLTGFVLRHSAASRELTDSHHC